MADEQVAEVSAEEPKEIKVEEPKAPEVQEPTPEELEKKKLEEDLISLGKAKTEALAELNRIREEKKALKKGKATEADENIPKIDLEDPAVKAWDKHMTEKVQPLQEYEDKARAEVRDYALQEFLRDKPALAKNPEKIKELMQTYDRLHTASERTVEGVLMDLKKSYGAVTYQEREAADNQRRIEQAKAEAEFSEAAITKGATGYQSPKSKKMPPLTDEQKRIIENQGWTVEEWWAAKQKQEKSA